MVSFHLFGVCVSQQDGSKQPAAPVAAALLQLWTGHSSAEPSAAVDAAAALSPLQVLIHTR